MTAHPVHQVSSSAASKTGWQWLHSAAEMAAIASAGPLLSTPVAATPASPDWTCFPRIAMRTPDIEPGSVSAARRFTTMTMRQWGVADHRGADVAVVVSELLSNALRHGLPPLTACPLDRPIRLGLVHAGPSIMCAVADPSDQMPVPREATWLDESGRGLQVVASLSDQWGSCAAPTLPGKVVWAKFATAELSSPAGPASERHGWALAVVATTAPAQPRRCRGPAA